MTLVRGGYNLYGRSIGILMLQTRFPRIPGDLGNATSFPFPVVHSVVAVLDGRYFNQQLIGDQPEFEVERMEREVVAAACSVLERHPRVGALVLECTNMVPYAHAIQRAIDRPVWDVMLLINAVQESL